MNTLLKKALLFSTAVLLFINHSDAQDGEALFKAKCAACHKTTKARMVGPGLGGIKERRSEEWLISWIKDSQALIKSGDADAKAIYEEYNQIMMTPFSDLKDAEIIAMLDFLSGGSSDGATASAAAEPAAPVEYAEGDAEKGKLLFTGSERFVNGGPSCVTCHNVKHNDVIPGGFLAKDLTNVFGRMGHAGITGIVSAPPFPAMAKSYGSKPITEEEANQLAAFFKDADAVSAEQTRSNGHGILAGGGIVGLLVILLIVSMIWKKRKKESTKKDIFSRQIRGNDSKVF